MKIFLDNQATHSLYSGHSGLVFLVSFALPGIASACGAAPASMGPLSVAIYLIYLFIPIVFIEYYALWRLIPGLASPLGLGVDVLGLNIVWTLKCVVYCILIGFLVLLMVPVHHPFIMEPFSLLTLVALFYYCRKFKFEGIVAKYQGDSPGEVLNAARVANFYTFMLFAFFMLGRFGKMIMIGRPLSF